jgi:hypothetical protein
MPPHVQLLAGRGQADPLERTMMNRLGLAKPPRGRKVRSLDRSFARGGRAAVSLISSLIHVRVPTSITGYHRVLNRVYRPTWPVLDGHPSS